VLMLMGGHEMKQQSFISAPFGWGYSLVSTYEGQPHGLQMSPTGQWGCGRGQYLLQTIITWRMASSGILHHMALVRTDVSEEHIASIIKVTRIDMIGTRLAVTSNRSMLRRKYVLLLLLTLFLHHWFLSPLMMEAVHSSKMSVLTRNTCRYVPEDSILHSHCHEDLKSCILTCFFATYESVK
jgi:hypothetical protein